MDARGRVAVVTGASAGVGRATVRELARRGWSIGLVARGRDGLAAAEREVRALGRDALSLEIDVADTAAVDSAAAIVESTLGPIDLWVNDAMVSVFGPFEQVAAGDFERVTQVTYFGTVNGTRAALQRMLPRDRGTIVQVGSALAERPIPLQSAYCGAKHAVAGFTGAVRTELLHRGSRVRICQAHLPALNTPQFDWVRSLLPNRSRPVSPIYQPEVAAEAIAWLVEHPRRELWVGASTVATILADRIVPGLLDRYLARTGYRSQQTDEPEDPTRRDNLYEPVPGDHGARGRFDADARSRSVQVALARHRSAVVAALLGAGAVALGRRPVSLTRSARPTAEPAVVR